MKRSYLMLLGAILIYSLVSVLSKAAALQDFLSLPFLCLYGGALLLMAVYAVIWQLCLEKVPLVAAYAMRGLMFVLVAIWSYLVFHESLSLLQWIGLVVIIAGVVVSESGDLHTDNSASQQDAAHTTTQQTTRAAGKDTNHNGGAQS